MMLAPVARAQINVTTTTIQGVSDISNCTLQEAMYATMFGGPYALNQTDPDVSYKTGCTDPSGLWYQIVLPGGTMQFNQLWDGDGHNPFGPTATPIVCNFIDIVGNGTTLEWTGSGYSRMFAVGYATFSPTSGPMTGTFCGVVTPNLTLQNVYIKGFQVKGGDGLGGGGGGLGAGGAIYIGRLPGKDQPSLTIQNSTFDGNKATGGQGGGCGNPIKSPDCNGGGGGLSGGGGAGVLDDGGGGGGGSRGDGGAGLGHAGGGGGGTVYGNGDAHDNIGGAAGVYCGGNGGDDGNDGHNGGPCAGGGGGGGGRAALLCGVGLGPCGNGGAGAYGGGGGGGGGGGHGNGGNGGFGGGGGGTSDCCSGDGHSPNTGGNGGFGGGAGLGNNGFTPGAAGYFGGGAIPALDGGFGGPGAGLGGAIFSDGGSVTIQNSTFANNKVVDGGRNSDLTANGSCCTTATGAAIFARNGSLTVENSTIAHNAATEGPGAGITVFGDNKEGPTYFTLHNTIIHVNGSFSDSGGIEDYPCFYLGTVADAVTFAAAGNLITHDKTPNFYSSEFPQQSDCSVGTTSTADPQLGPLQVNSPGNTPTMVIPYGTSPAIDAGDDAVATADGITTDQRGVTRPQGPHVDIGAYEATVKYPLTIQVSPFGGGSTSPSGTVWEDPNSVVDVSATGASGYYFLNWSGNVAAANSASTAVTMPSQADTITANFQLHDFSITSSPNPLSLKLGGSASTTLTVSSLGNFADKISLTAVGTGIPAGVTVSLSPTSLTPAIGGSLTSALSFTAGPSVTPANFSETVTGSSTGLSGALSHGILEPVTMVVTAADIINVVNQNQSLGCIDNSGIAQSLNAKLNAFQLLSTGGHVGAAVNTVASFQYETQAQAGRHIASACKDGSGTQFSPAQTLVTDTTYLLAAAGAAKVQANPIMGSVVNSSNSGISGATVHLLSSSKTVIATSTTDAVGFYYLAGTSSLAPGASYTVAVTPPKGYKSSTPASQAFTWNSTTVALNKFVLN